MECLKFVFEQIFTAILSRQESGIKKWLLKLKLKKMIEAEIQSMERLYDCSIIDSDKFFVYVQYHKPFLRIQECLMDTESESEEKEIIDEIMNSFDADLSGDNYRLVRIYFEKIYSITRKFYIDNVITESERFMLAEINKKYNKQAHLLEQKIADCEKRCHGRAIDTLVDEDVLKTWKKGYLFIDGTILPFDTVEVIEEPYMGANHYVIRSSYYRMEYYILDCFIIYASFEYHLHSKDVNDRLIGFDKILRIIDADKMELQIDGETNRQELHTDFIQSLGDLVQKTRLWTEQMKLICTLERMYNTKFQLPKELSETDFYSLEIFRDIVEKRPVASLIISETEDYKELQGGEISEDLNLPDIYLFGKKFCAVKGIIQFEGKPIKHKDGNMEIPLVVEFELK